MLGPGLHPTNSTKVKTYNYLTLIMGKFSILASQVFARHVIPMATNYVMEKMNQNNQKKIHQLEIQKYQKIKLALGSSDGSTNGSTISLSKGFLPKESIDDLGRRKWDEYHKKIDSLPENSSQVQVHNALKEIIDNIKVYPCLTCRENSLRNLKKFPLLTSSVKTKKDGQKRICGFHNVVREMLNKPITHNCDVV